MYRTRYYPARRNTNAFTLIEILVVIVIIGLLAALLFPVFAMARRKACATTCLSNLRQIGQAIQMYQQDYSGQAPPHNPFWLGWRSDRPMYEGYDPLKPYGAIADIYRCPEWVVQPGPPTNYEWRFQLDLRERTRVEQQPSDKNHRRVRLEHNSIVAHCIRHLTEGYRSYGKGYRYSYPASRRKGTSSSAGEWRAATGTRRAGQGMGL